MADQNSKLIIVSNRSPVSDFLKGGDKVSIGGLASAMHRVAIETKAIWVFGTDSDNDTSDEYQSPASLEYTLSPVFISKKQYNSYYGGYSNSLIWPLFHYFPDKSIFKADDWENYQAINRKFAIQILDFADKYPEATIWIQDYHLLLVAKYLRQFGVKNKIGFFLHIPFPTYEVFRLIPQRREILESMLSIDLIGFHVKSYVANFFRSVKNIVKEDISIDEENNTVCFEGREILIKDFPISVDAEMITNIVKDLDTKNGYISHKQLEDVDIIGLGVDRLDYTKGLFERFKALEFFFDKNPKYREKLTFIQIAVPSRSSVSDYQDYKAQVEQIVSRINGKFGTLDWTPIMYINRSIPFEHLVKYYRIADFTLVTPLRDGMNLVAKEFLLACKDKASLILSEMCGAAEELPEVNLVNPYNQEQISDAITECLENPGKQEEAIKKYRNYLSEHNVHKWADDFIETLSAKSTNPKLTSV